jgi:hypothetical protein
MDYIERKIFEIVQTNNELNKEEIILLDEGNSKQKNSNILEKVSGILYYIVKYYKILVIYYILLNKI